MVKEINGRIMKYSSFSQGILRHSVSIKKCLRADVLVYDMRHENDERFKLDDACMQWLNENGFKEVQNFTEWQKEQYRAFEKNEGDYYLFFGN